MTTYPADDATEPTRDPDFDPDFDPAGDPPARSRMLGVYVLQSGLITTAVTLFAFWWMAAHWDFYPMGWYAYFVIPVGGILVGLLAGSGYGLASWFAGVRVRTGLLVTVAALLLGGYVASLYLQYRAELPGGVVQFEGDDGSTVEVPIGFFEYLDLTIRAFAFAPKGGGEGTPMGVWGYAFKALEMAGFVGGGLIAPLALTAMPYCDDCGRYQRTRQLGVVPASVPERKVKKLSPDEVAAYEAEVNAAGEAGQATARRLVELAVAGDGASFRRELAPSAEGRKANDKLPRRIHVSLSACPSCGKGTVQQKLATGHGKQQSIVDLAEAEVSPEFTAALDDKAPATA